LPRSTPYLYKPNQEEANVNHRAPRRIDSFTQLLTLVATTLTLAVVPQATPASTPLLALGPITVAHGTATLAGTVGSEASGETLTVNGRPLAIDASGHFAGTVSVAGSTSLELALTSPGGDERTTFTIPLTGSLLTAGGLIPGNVLASLEQAAVTLKSITGGGVEPFTVAGSVLDRGQLAGLTVNGTDVLGTLGQGGSFTTQLPGTTKTVTLTATDRHGVMQTVVARTPFAATVAAANAVGIRIAGLRYATKGVLRTHRARLIVTVADNRGLLIRGARIVVRGTKPGRLVRHPRTTFSGMRGRATVTLPLRRRAFGTRLVTITVARTPTATTKKRASVRIPRLGRHA
jgi:hypothetical protein